MRAGDLIHAHQKKGYLDAGSVERDPEGEAVYLEPSDKLPANGSQATEWKPWADKICSAWQKCTESIIATGKLLVEAKDVLPYGSFEAMVKLKLPFDVRTAQMLMKIAGHPVISNAKHVSLLPPSWGTLYELSRLPEQFLIEKIEDGGITPRMARKDAITLVAIAEMGDDDEEEEQEQEQSSGDEPEAKTQPPTGLGDDQPALDAVVVPDPSPEPEPRRKPTGNGDGSDVIAACVAEVRASVRAAIAKLDISKISFLVDDLRKAITGAVAEATMRDAETDRWTEATQ